VTTTDHPIQTAIVTGGARGLGLGIAKRLAAEGRRVILWDLDFKDFSAPQAGFEPLLTQQVDVADLESVAQAFNGALSAAGRIDILVNNAGINGPIAPTWEYPVDQWRRVLDIDLTGVFNCCRTAIPHLLANGYGRIVNVASNAGKDCNPYQSAYSASKAAVIGLTKSLGRELAESGIIVNCITPALIDTPLAKVLTDATRAAALDKIPMRRMGRPEEVAALVAWLASEQVSFSTGAAYDLSGGRAPY